MAHKILMVEDDFALAMGTEYALTSEGYAVATAGNLAQAREKHLFSHSMGRSLIVRRASCDCCDFYCSIVDR